MQLGRLAVRAGRRVPRAHQFLEIAAAGLAGIANKYELPEPKEKNIFHMTEEERQAEGIYSLPGSLNEALQSTEKSQLVKEALGDHIYTKFLENKKIEWDAYRTHVSNYEIERYLPIL